MKASSEFFIKLLEVSEVRTAHDKCYREKAVPSTDDRAFLEHGIAKKDDFFVDDGKERRNPKMRHHGTDGELVTFVDMSALRSKEMKTMCKFFSQQRLKALDMFLMTVPVNGYEQQISDWDGGELDVGERAATGSEERKKELQYARSLALLVRKRQEEAKTFRSEKLEKLSSLYNRFSGTQLAPAVLHQDIPIPTTAETLWPHIVQRTDAIFDVSEQFLDVFKQTLDKLKQRLAEQMYDTERLESNDRLVVDHMRSMKVTDWEAVASGLKWKEVGTEKPASGIELTNAALSEALKTEHEFTKDGWESFGVKGLTGSHFILVGEKYFQPAVLTTYWQTVAKWNGASSGVEDAGADEGVDERELFGEDETDAE